MMIPLILICKRKKKEKVDGMLETPSGTEVFMPLPLICGQNFLHQAAASNDLMQQAQIFLYGHGNDHPPTAIELNKSLLRDLLFNQSPAKVHSASLHIQITSSCQICWCFWHHTDIGFF